MAEITKFSENFLGLRNPRGNVKIGSFKGSPANFKKTVASPLFDFFQRTTILPVVAFLGRSLLGGVFGGGCEH